MNIRLLINESEADYKEIANLDFSVKAKIRDFKRIASVEGFELDNAVKLLPLPSTNRNKQILLSRRNEVLSLKIFVGHEQRFSGKCVFVSTTKSKGELLTLNIRVFGGNSDFIQKINSLILRDLDLGNEWYRENEIVSSWSADASTRNGIFAPVIYGALNSGIAGNWSVEDVRYHVYFNAILTAIATSTGITIESDFISRDIWLKSCHTFGVGDGWKALSQANLTDVVTGAQTQRTFTITQDARYSLTIIAPASGTYDPDHLEITTGTGLTYGDYTYTAGEELVITINNINLVTGNTLTISGKDSSDNLTNLPVGMRSTLTGGWKVLKNNQFVVSSCLPNEPVKKLFAAWVEMFNWCMYYNPVKKTLKIEPMFDYQIGSTTYNGFYMMPKDAFNELTEDIESVTEEFNPIFDIIDFSFKENKTCDSVFQQQSDSNIEILGTRTTISDGTDIQKQGDRYFKRLYNGQVVGVNDNAVFFYPLLLDEDFKIKNSNNTIETPTFEFQPSFFFVTNLVHTINFEGTNRSGVPVCSQVNIDTSDNYSMSWCDVEANGITKEGLISTFYPLQLAIFRRFEIIKTYILLDNIMGIDVFRKLYKRGNEFFILSLLEDVKLNSKKYKAELVKMVALRSSDAAETEHYDINDSKLTLISIT